MKFIFKIFCIICISILFNTKSVFSQYQSDTSDTYWEVVMPLYSSQNIDMKKVLINTAKDSLISDFIQNTGSWKFRIDSIYIKGNDKDYFELVSGFPTYYVDVNDSYYAEFRFSPTEERIYNAEIVIISQADSLVKKITGEGIIKILEINENIIDFGKVELGTSNTLQQVYTIRNIGNNPLVITDTKHNLPNNIDFTTILGGGSFTLQPNETHNMDLKFEPSGVGRTSGTLEFYYDGVGSPAVIQLFGEGIRTKPALQSRTDLFSNIICENSETKEIEIKNIGGADLIISSINITGDNPSDFNINQTIPITILPDSSYILEVDFIPNSAGEKTATIEISSNSQIETIHKIPISAKKDIINFDFKDTYDLGVLCPDESEIFEIEITNSSTIESYIDITNDSDISSKSNHIKFDVSQNDNLQFEFTGISQEGAFNRTISIQDSCENIRDIVVTGIIETPKIEFNNLNFISALNTNLMQDIEIRNNSQRAITINNIDGVLAPFSIVGNPFPIEIQSNSSAYISIDFLPNTVSTFSQELTVEIEQCSLKELIEISGSALQAGLTLKVNEDSAFAGDEITIPIISEAEDNLRIAGVQSIDFDLEYNPTLLAPINYEQTIISNNIAYISFKDIPISEIDGSSLLNIKFVAGLGNAEFCDLKLTNIKLNEGIADVKAVNGKFNLLGICDEGGTRLVNPTDNNFIFTISPNPSDGNVEISINLLEEGTKSLKIYDYNGAIVEEFDLSSNLGNINLNLNTQRYSNGLYFVHLQTPTIIKREKLIINR